MGVNKPSDKIICNIMLHCEVRYGKCYTWHPCAANSSPKLKSCHTIFVQFVYLRRCGIMSRPLETAEFTPLLFTHGLPHQFVNASDFFLPIEICGQYSYSMHLISISAWNSIERCREQ